MHNQLGLAGLFFKLPSMAMPWDKISVKLLKRKKILKI
jgi:hypothetical protein